MHHSPMENPHTSSIDLPAQLTPFIGREQDVASICAKLQQPEIRLLTLVGMGGIGKTRLCLQAAAMMHDAFADGICFVPLAAIRDHELVISTLARQLGIQELGMQSALEQVKVALQHKQLLLILDNFEQVVTAALQVKELLIACPGLKAMVTSREVLHLHLEHIVSVQPFPLPDLDHLPKGEAFLQHEAIALFIRRAQTTVPTFSVTPANARVIAEICVRLDGLPLAIELAAARLRLLPLQDLLARLSQRLRVLTRGTQDMPVRQQTLRNTIQWSYDLLLPEEQRLFRRLSVFVGSFALEEAEMLGQLGHETGSEVLSPLDSLESLLDKSLLLQVAQGDEEPRLTMLETIREYGLACLHESGEAPICQRAHALYFLGLAEEAEPHLQGIEQVWWWKRLERERENLRAALDWLIAQGEGELALRLGSALWWFWDIRAYWSEGQRWLETALALPQAQNRTARRAKALYGAAELTYGLGNLLAGSLIQESVSISRELGDKRGLALSLSGLGWGMKDIVAARPFLEEGLTFAREVGDHWILARALRNVGYTLYHFGDLKSADRFLEESVALCRALKDKHSLCARLLDLAEVTAREGDMAQASTLVQESLALAQELGNGPDILRALYGAAAGELVQGHIEQAVALFEGNLVLAREQGDRLLIGMILLLLGSVMLRRGDLLQAETYAQNSLTVLRELGNNYRIALALRFLGDVKRNQGNLAQAREACKEGLLLARAAGSPYNMGWNIIGLARIAASEEKLEQAARLFSAAETLYNPRVDLHPDMDPLERLDYERAVESVQTRLGEAAFTAAWAQGQKMTPEQILAEGEIDPPILTIPLPSQTRLTPREMDVLRPLTQGLTSAQIAEQLVIAEVTVNFHVRSIFSKLGVNSRAAATRYAIEHKLV